MSSSLTYIESPSLDRERWNRAIDDSERSLAYGYTEYLDAVCTHWGGIVSEEYEFVMPLPWNAKFLLFRQVYMPPYVQQIGPFGPGLKKPLWDDILAAVPREIRYMQLSMSHPSHIGPAEKRANLILSLDRSHEAIFSDYSSNHRRNVRRSREEGFSIKPVRIEPFLDFADHHYLPKIPEQKRHHSAYHRLVPTLVGSSKAVILGVQDRQGKMLAAAFLPHTPTRTTLLIPVTSRSGRDRRAMFYLIDELVREFAGSNRILDFEGSTIPSIARFYKGFGAQNEPYYVYRHNRLPLGLKQFIRWYKQR